jgi:hypothetical protein
MALRTLTTRTAWIASAAIVAVGLALAVALSVWSHSGAGAAGPLTLTPSGATAGTGTSALGASTAPSAAGASPGASPGASTRASSPGATPAPAPTRASELQPTPATLGIQPPPSPASGPSLSGPLPATASARGGALVAGFPTQVVPVLAGIRLVSSSVSGQGSRLQIGFEGSSSASPAAVISGYTATLTGSGFLASPSPALPGTTATEFSRGPDGVVLTVDARVGGGTELSVVGTLTTAG